MCRLLLLLLAGCLLSGLAPAHAMTADALVHSPGRPSAWRWCGSVPHAKLERGPNESAMYMTYPCASPTAGALTRCKVRQARYHIFSKHWFLECDEGLPFGVPPLFADSFERRPRGESRE